jgi:formamidopyrimidine-DNA glycosylase
MPELPEVETIRSQLEKYIPLRIIAETRSHLITSLTRKSLQNKLVQVQGCYLVAIRRHGKILLFDFKTKINDAHISYTVVSQLGMSGGWRISKHKLEKPHIHLEWLAQRQNSKDRIYLSYNDPRRFGALGFLTFKEAQLKINSLGVDVSSSEFNENYLSQIIHQFPNKMLKPFLLDQKYFAGIGNYMANEICARAQIRPQRRLKTIKSHEISKIVSATKQVLNLSQKTGGLTFSGGYADAYGRKGQGLTHLVVFHQKICQMCKKTEVKKINLGNRGTFYCPSCQK